MPPHLKTTVLRTGSLRDALRAIEDSGLEVSLAIDEQDRLVGILTDGDIRRCLLMGISLDAPLVDFMQTRFKSVGPQSDRSAVLDLMRALTISQIPIVDNDGRLLGLHTLLSAIGDIERANWAVVMAGGRGERLRPLTNETPKPMLKVAGRPILERILLHLVSFGIRRVFLSVNYKADVIEEYFGDGSSFGCSIDYLREKDFLGTGGSLSLLPRLPGHPILVMNGDLLTQVDIARMLEFHETRRYSITVGLREYSHTVPLGVVKVDKDLVVGFQEKPTSVWRVNAGIYVLDANIAKRVPENTHFGLPALIQDCLDRGETVGAFGVEEDWIDVGQPRDLVRARGED